MSTSQLGSTVETVLSLMETMTTALQWVVYYFNGRTVFTICPTSGHLLWVSWQPTLTPYRQMLGPFVDWPGRLSRSATLEPVFLRWRLYLISSVGWPVRVRMYSVYIPQCNINCCQELVPWTACNPRTPFPLLTLTYPHCRPGREDRHWTPSTQQQDWQKGVRIFGRSFRQRANVQSSVRTHSSWARWCEAVSSFE